MMRCLMFAVALRQVDGRGTVLPADRTASSGSTVVISQVSDRVLDFRVAFCPR